MSSPIPLLILGAGFSRRAHAPALGELGPKFRVVGVFSRTEEKARAAAAAFSPQAKVFTNLEEALAQEGLEAVDVALPILPASDAVDAALRRGLHVFSEKPIAESVERARALIQLHASRPGQVWCVAENFRFWRTAWKVKELIASGEIGAPVVCHYPVLVPIKATPWFRTDWRRTPEYDGGFLLDGGVHDMAALRLMLGEVTEVSAFTRSVDPELPPADTLVASLQFDSGVVANYTATYALERQRLTYWGVARSLVNGAARRAEDCHGGRKHIVGTRGSLFFSRDRVELVRGTQRTVFSMRSRAVVEELDEFWAGVREGKPVRNTPHEALRDLAVLEAMLTSARSRRFVRPAPGAEPPSPVAERVLP